MENEIFKPIKDYEESYLVSNYGRIISLQRIVIHGNRKLTVKEKLLKNTLEKTGYHTVNLYKPGKTTKKQVHQIVAESFLGHTSDGYKKVINHKNHVRNDNRVENLEIVTQRKNTNKKHIKSSSKYVGVSFNKLRLKWRAFIRINGVLKSLGSYTSEYNAHLAYEKALSDLSI